ncbi:MAG: hypothetical protein HUK03_10255, partial [Bacteroidaceae bacterium]|nr:hypothetical protein [Bacteroidaceae bacterium]
DDEEHRTALDLLLMTQGWRRFNWQDMAVKGKWKGSWHNELQLTLTGRVVKADDADPRLQTIRDEMHVFHPEWEMEDSTQYRGIAKKLRRKKKSSDTASAYVVHSEIHIGDDVYPLTNVGTDAYGAFTVKVPLFYGDCHLFMGAIPRLDFNPSQSYYWNELCDPEYLTMKELRNSEIAPSSSLVLIDYPYPRFVLPYSYYQTHLSSVGGRAEAVDTLDRTLRTLDEVTVKNKFRGLLRFTDEYPAFVSEDYEALNQTIDAGLYYTKNVRMKTLLGDMGLEHIPPLEADIRESVTFQNQSDEDDNALSSRISVRHRFGLDRAERMVRHGLEVPDDSLYSGRYLRSYPGKAGLTHSVLRRYLGLGAIDKSFYYTDYSPRLMGDERYVTDFPQVNIVHYPHDNGGQYPLVTDRNFRFTSFAPPAQFYSPDYSRQPLPEVKD